VADCLVWHRNSLKASHLIHRRWSSGLASPSEELYGVGNGPGGVTTAIAWKLKTACAAVSD
jgi:hypothetical protein